MITPCRFDDKEYTNWIKCSQALILFKEGLHDFIKTEVTNFHAHIQQNVAKIPGGSSVGSHCGVCIWKNIRRTVGWQGVWSINCQNKICDKWLSQILLEHTDKHNRTINWKNADVSKWPTDAYEVAKVYMPKGQDKTKNLPEDFDASAVLSLLKYCTWFSQKVQTTSILSDLRDFRNEVMHSGDLRVTDSITNSCIDKMIQLLSELNIHGDFCTELLKIKREDIDINFRETEVRALHSLVSSIKDKMDSLQDAQTQQRQDIEEVKGNTMETKGKVVTMDADIQGVKLEFGKIKSFLANNPDIDDKNIFENIQAIEKTVMDMESKLEKVHQEIASLRRHVRGIKKGIKIKFAEIEGNKETNILQDMENLRNELLHRYKSFRTIPLSPIDEKEVPVQLEYFYTETVIKCEYRENAYASRSLGKERMMEKEKQVEKVTPYNRSSNKERIMEKEKQEEKLVSYKQIFENGRRTILTGLSGSGKSTFCKKIVDSWCKLQEKRKIGIGTDEEKSSAKESSNVSKPSTNYTPHVKGSTHDTSHVTGSSTCDTSHVTGSSTLDTSNMARPSALASTSALTDESVLMNFDLLFYINSPAISNETVLTNILCNQCIKREQDREKDEIQNKLSKLLHDQPEKILIIFDGLDEMGHTPTFLVDVFKRVLYPGVSVLMAMRPWRISGLDLKPLSHYDLLLDVQGFSTDNALKFVQKVIDMNSSMYGETKMKCLSWKDREIFTSFKNTPLLLLFLAHIWYREQSLPEKYKDLYNQIIDFLIKRWVKKTGNKCTVAVSEEESMELLLKNFQDSHFSSACKVAHHFLLEGENGQSVVIPQKELVRELGENSEVKLIILLNSGIMSKVDFFSPLEKNISVTFLHMSIQEYLASIYLVQNEDAFQKFLKSLGTLNDILRYENLFVFISGLDPCKAHKAFIRICGVCEVDPLVIQYRETGDNCQVIHNLNDMYKKCANEMNEQESIEISDVTFYKTYYKLRSCFVKSLYLNCIWCSGVPDMSNLAVLKLSNISMSKRDCRPLQNTCLKILNLKLIKLHDDVLDLSALTNLTSLTMSSVTISAECSRSLCSSISSCPHLEKLKLEGISLHDGVLDMGTLTNLTSFKMSCVAMSAECSRSLCSSISSCGHLEKLKLDCLRLHDGVLDMNSLTNLTSFKMSRVTMSEECSRSLCSSISGCAHLEKLILTNQTLHDGELDLSKLTNLTYIYEFCVTMTEECRRSMCTSISGCTQMKTLYLEYSSLHGALDLSTLTNLTYLNLYNVIMSEECSRSLCSSISGCTRLDKLVLNNNINLHDGVLDLSSLTSLTYLYMTNVTMSAECGRSLCSSISVCTRLESLTLTDVTIHNGVLDLKTLKNLKYVQIWGTMSSECTKILDQSFQHCPKLEFWYTATRLGGYVE